MIDGRYAGRHASPRRGRSVEFNDYRPYIPGDSPADVDLLRKLARIAALSHAPFLTAADPGLLGLKSWQELNDGRDVSKSFDSPDYASWRSLRQSEDSRYLGLTLPRILARLPYGLAAAAVEGFEYREAIKGTGHDQFAWMNSAYAMAVNLTRAFTRYGWCCNILGFQGGATMDGLPTHSFPSDDGSGVRKCPLEIALTDRYQSELAKNGFMPLLHPVNTSVAVFIGGQSLHRPAIYDDPEAAANSILSARLPGLCALCRFAQALQSLVSANILSVIGRLDLQKYCQNWLDEYVLVNSTTATEEQKARRPLASAKIEIIEWSETARRGSAQLSIRPLYQLGELAVHLVTQLQLWQGGYSRNPT